MSLGWQVHDFQTGVVHEAAAGRQEEGVQAPGLARADFGYAGGREAELLSPATEYAPSMRQFPSKRPLIFERSPMAFPPRLFQRIVSSCPHYQTVLHMQAIGRCSVCRGGHRVGPAPLPEGGLQDLFLVWQDGLRCWVICSPAASNGAGPPRTVVIPVLVGIQTPAPALRSRPHQELGCRRQRRHLSAGLHHCSPGPRRR